MHAPTMPDAGCNTPHNKKGRDDSGDEDDGYYDQGQPSEEELATHQEDAHPKKPTASPRSLYWTPDNVELAGEATVQVVNAISSNHTHQEEERGVTKPSMLLHPVYDLLKFRADFLCRCLQPEDSISLLSLNRDLRNDINFHEIIVDAGVDELRRLQIHLSDAKTLGDNKFKRLEKVLRLILHPKIKDVLAHRGPGLTRAASAFIDALKTLLQQLQFEDWSRLLSLNDDIWNKIDLHEIIVDICADQLRRLHTHFSDARTLGDSEFERLEEVLRLIVHPRVKDALVDRAASALKALLQKFIFWIEASNATDESHDAYQQRRRRLRRMDLKVWFAAMREYKELSPYFFQVLCRWPLSFNDRDIFLHQFHGASLLALADCDDRKSILWACKFACRFSCGSAKRVACTESERFKFSAKAAKALNKYAQDVNVVVAALGYLSNVANCPEHWEALKQLRIETLCDNVLENLRSHPQVAEFAEAIKSTLQQLTV